MINGKWDSFLIYHFSLHISHFSICLTLECCLFQLLRPLLHVTMSSLLRRRRSRSRVSRFIFYYAISHCGSCKTRIYFSFPIPGLMANNGKLHHFSFNISHFSIAEACLPTCSSRARQPSSIFLSFLHMPDS